MSIVIKNIQKSYPTKEVFRNISCVLHSWSIYGLIGENGSWKSTLMKILSGAETPDEGSVLREGPVHYFAQSIAFSAETVYEYLMSDLPDRQQSKAYDLLDDFGVGHLLSSLMTELSPGEQTKIRLIALALTGDSFWLLDEPTNHLDHGGITMLQKLLKNHTWGVVIVSHDRVFLDTVCDRCLMLEKGSLKIYEGGYTTAVEAYQAQKTLDTLQYQREQKELKDRHERLAKIRERAHIFASPGLWRLLRSKEKFVARIEAKTISKPMKQTQLALSLEWGTHHKKLLLDTPRLKVFGHDKILIQWPNGVWKSTRARSILDQIQWNYLMFDQWLESLDRNKKVSQWVMQDLAQDESRLIGGFVSLGMAYEQRQRPIGELSHGQPVKTWFLHALMGSYDMMILDEPTNHLDTVTRDAIEEMILGFEGALIVVTHDEYFIKKIAWDEVYNFVW